MLIAISQSGKEDRESWTNVSNWKKAITANISTHVSCLFCRLMFRCKYPRCAQTNMTALLVLLIYCFDITYYNNNIILSYAWYAHFSLTLVKNAWCFNMVLRLFPRCHRPQRRNLWTAASITRQQRKLSVSLRMIAYKFELTFESLFLTIIMAPKWNLYLLLQYD